VNTPLAAVLAQILPRLGRGKVASLTVLIDAGHRFFLRLAAADRKAVDAVNISPVFALARLACRRLLSTLLDLGR
jgi:hypothetical protein